MSQSNWALVTGAGSGIGRALSIALVSRGLQVIAVGRRKEALKETHELATKAVPNAQIKELAADIATTDGRKMIAEQAAELCGAGRANLSYVIHNAAILGEVGSLSNITCEGYQHAMAVNVEGPLFVTQALLPILKNSAASQDTRVLHISSGAAHSPLEGWLTYCTSKAALLQMMRCLDQELAPLGIRVGSVMPGVVDTPMQGQLRTLKFPNVGYFQKLGSSTAARPWEQPAAPPRGSLDRPENVADFLAWLLLEAKSEEFGGREWDINDPACQRQWLAVRGS